MTLITQNVDDLHERAGSARLIHMHGSNVRGWCLACGDRFAWSVAERLRDAGLKAIFHCGGGSFKSQMKRADSSGARYAVIVGDDEAARGVLSVKPLRQLGEQVQLAVDEAAALIRAAGQ